MTKVSNQSWLSNQYIYFIIRLELKLQLKLGNQSFKMKGKKYQFICTISIIKAMEIIDLDLITITILYLLLFCYLIYIK